MAAKQHMASAAVAGSIVEPQGTRLKSSKNNEGRLKSITRDYCLGDDRSSTAGVDGRDCNIERLTVELNEVIDQKEKEDESTQRHEEIREKEQKEKNIKQQDENAASHSSKRPKVSCS